jgi:hypothetical protein
MIQSSTNLIKNRAMRDENGQFIKGGIGFWNGKKRPEIKNWLKSFEKGNVPWNKGLNKATDLRVKDHGEKLSVFKTGKGKNESNPNWKGDRVSYMGLHKWVYRHLGRPVECVNCLSMKKVQWANKSGEYKRDLNDWIRLCYWCHRKYDKRIGWGKIRAKYV